MSILHFSPNPDPIAEFEQNEHRIDEEFIVSNDKGDEEIIVLFDKNGDIETKKIIIEKF